MDQHLRYPIGDFQSPQTYSNADLARWTETLRTYPGRVRQAVIGLTDAQLETPYRPGGWTIRQVVHHVADSHMNCIVRVKLALTEENPTIKPYEEDRWALQVDYKLPIEPSLRILEGIHQHLTTLFESFTLEQLERTYFHPASQQVYPLKKVLALYAWHSEHHLAHIEQAKRSFTKD